jgi:ADP-ribose pyrophosphatase YjhB (NUDIX family)
MPHINKLIDYTITAFIVYDQTVLMVNHPRYQKWLPPGGHIELDEDPEQALYREIAEETGLEVEILSSKPSIASPGSKFLLTPNYVDIHDANEPHRHVAFVYFARATHGNAVQSDEHDDMRWLIRTELNDATYNLSPALIFYAEAALDLAQNV